MVSEIPPLPKKARFSVKETISILGISRTSLYRYVKAGFINACARPCNGRFFFTGGEITRFWGSEYVS